MGVHQVVKVTGSRIVLKEVDGLDQIIPLRNGAFITLQVDYDFYLCIAT